LLEPFERDVERPRVAPTVHAQPAAQRTVHGRHIEVGDAADVVHGVLDVHGHVVHDSKHTPTCGLRDDGVVGSEDTEPVGWQLLELELLTQPRHKPPTGRTQVDYPDETPDTRRKRSTI
jgi:hypothetical protein